MRDRRIILIIIILPSFALLYCSDVKTKFSESELKWAKVYNAGDSLVFKSDAGEYDTSIIVKKEIYYPDYNPGEVHGKYLPQWCDVWYKNNKLEYNPEGDRLITMFKKEPNKNTYLNLSYLYSSFTILDLGSGVLNKFRNGKTYEFNTGDPAPDSKKLKKLFWHEDFGLIKYITHDGKVWTRVNLQNK